MNRIARYSLLAASIGLVSACGAKLLWEAHYARYAPNTVASLAVDTENNAYVGAGIRTPDYFWGAPTFTGVLLKYNADGALLWDSPVFEGGTILAVAPLSASLVAVAVGSPGGNPDVPAELWLVSAASGQPVNKIASYGADGGTHYFQSMKVIGEQLYVASGRHGKGCEFFSQCDTEQFGGAVDVYDAQGSLIRQRTLDDAEVVAIDSAGAGSLAVLLRGAQTGLQYWSGDLQTSWDSSAAMATSLALADCRPEGLQATAQGAHVLCLDSVAKFSWSGQLVFNSPFNALLRETLSPSGETATMQYWGWDGGSLAVDASGNVLVAKARNTVYFPSATDPVSFGGVTLNSLTALGADVVTVKLDGQSGAVLWADDINSPILGESGQLKAFFYSPLDLNVSGDKVLVTFQGVIANYDYCGEMSDWDVPWFNTCHLASMAERYGKTIAYRNADGKRVAQQRHAIEFPRKAGIDTAGQLIVAGDGESGYLDTWESFITYGIDLIYDDTSRVEPAITSDVVVQKFKF